jgi:selenocysteine lyase/cysteine desulfurase
MYNRRQFIGAIGRPAAVAAAMIAINPQEIINVKEAAANLSSTPEEIAQDESFWFKVQQAFSVDRSLVNLNSGGVSPAPTGVQDAMKRYLDYSNTAPVYSMWRILEPQREGVRKRLAIFFDCDPEEIALTRNASEGLQICQFGFDLKPGDEVLTTNQDYPRMITTWQQRERREKIILKQFSLPVPSEDEDEIVDLFRKNISNKTKLILMCHMINLTGQLLPVKKVVNMARERGIPVIVDGAHSFAHIDFKIRDLDCDYFATSLHKWLYAPHGTGLLYVQQNKIKDLWPMMAASENLDTDIRKFEEIGTHPAANYLAIADALTFNEGIGLRRKEARMRYLRDYWVKKLLTYEEIQLHTSLYLWKNYRIIVTTIKHPEFEGLRVSPNLFTTLEELDRFIVAMKMAIEKGIES